MQINFKWNGKREWFTLDLTDTPANFSKAAKIREDFVTKAKYGILKIEDIEAVTVKPIKKSDAAQKTLPASNAPTFAHYAQEYLYNLSDHKHGTKKKYLSILERLWMPLFADMPINTISSQMLRSAVNGREWSSSKTRNDALIPLRGAFELANDDEIIDKNPCDRLKNQKTQETEPDPFNEIERERILNWLREKYLAIYPTVYWYFVVAFWTGCRPSEIIALTWQDVDFLNKQIHINKGRVNGVQQETTKTNKARFVDLNDFAFEAFQQLRLLTYLKYDHVFICDETGEEFTTQKSLSEKFVAALKANDIRYRPAYNTRHTYATVCLMNGLNPVYVASQLGHSLVMLMKRYAKWINSDKNKEEIAKISNSAKIVPKKKGIKLCI
ncbi:tyrosine-type recombinase/integrase [Acinetobacter vivianii]|nr:site-specific integrase [Acinetobacter vivianii]